MAEEMAGEKEIACCVRGYHVYKDTYMGSSKWEGAGVSSLVCRHRKIFIVKLYLHKIFSHIFCARKYSYNEKKRITVLFS